VDLRLPASSWPGVPVLRRSGPVDAASNPPPGQTWPAGDPGTVQARSAIATWSRGPHPCPAHLTNRPAACSPPTGCWPASCSTSGSAWLTLSERMGQARGRCTPRWWAANDHAGDGHGGPGESVRLRLMAAARPGGRGVARRRPSRQRRGGPRRRPAVHRQRSPKGWRSSCWPQSAWPWRARQCSAPWWPTPARPDRQRRGAGSERC
jgi:hypothetical protein